MRMYEKSLGKFGLIETAPVSVTEPLKIDGPVFCGIEQQMMTQNYDLQQKVISTKIDLEMMIWSKCDPAESTQYHVNRVVDELLLSLRDHVDVQIIDGFTNKTINASIDLAVKS